MAVSYTHLDVYKRQACTLADAAQGYELEFTLSETDAEHAQLGAQVQVVQKNQTQTAAVTALGAPREDGSLTVTAQLEGGDWKQGAATGTMTLSRTDYDLCVPASAVHSDNRGTFVYVLEERETVLGMQNVLLRVPVEVLENGRTQTAIFSAILTAFDQVVASSTKPLSKGCLLYTSCFSWLHTRLHTVVRGLFSNSFQPASSRCPLNKSWITSGMAV